MVSLAAQRGYTYLLVLFLVAGLGLVTAGVGQTWQARAQHDKERELLAVGAEIARALGRYRDRAPEGAPTWPARLEDLLEDRRFPTPQRHLRRIYRDPMTLKPEWGLVLENDRIAGIHSLGEGKPFRATGLPEELGEGGGNAQSYREWVFRPVPAAAKSRAPAATGDADAVAPAPVTRGPRPILRDE
jgi:type II secretory pathway pseudopilin PulG